MWISACMEKDLLSFYPSFHMMFLRQVQLKLNKKMNTYNYYRHYLTTTISHIQSNNNFLTLKGLTFARPSSSPLKFAPHESPSRRTLNNYALFIVKPSRKTLNNFDKPSRTLIIHNITGGQQENPFLLCIANDFV